MALKKQQKYFYGLPDDLINAYVESLGFKTVADGHAQVYVSDKRYLFINSSEFGIRRGKTKVGQIFYPEIEHWDTLKKEAELSDVVFVLVTYECYHAWSVNGRKFFGAVKTNIENWWEHSGLLMREGKEDWKYFDCQFYTGVVIRKHYAYRAVSTSIKRKIEQVLGWQKEKVGIRVQKFSQHVGISNACTIPILYVLEAVVKKWDMNPYNPEDNLQKYLHKLCTYFEEKGFGEIWGYEPWESIQERLNYRKKLRI